MAALPTNIRGVIEAGVDAMDAPTYNYAYGPVDVFDAAQWPDGSPQVFLEEGGWNPGTITGTVGKITQSTLLTFRVVVPKGPGDIDPELDNVDSDIKRLMGALEESLRAQGCFVQLFLGSLKKYRLVVARPGEISVRYGLTWRQNRLNPTSL